MASIANQPSTSTPLKRDHEEAELSDLSGELENKIPALFVTPPGINLPPSQESRSSKLTELEIPPETPQWAKTILSQFWQKFEELERSKDFDNTFSSETKETCENLQKSVKELTNQITDIQNKMETKMNILEEENRQLNTKLLKLEGYSRRDNMLICGFPEEFGETSYDCTDKVRHLFYDIGFEYPENIGIVRCHRKGKANYNSNTGRFYGPPRPIIVKFQWPEEREYIWESRMQLKGSGYFFAEDFPETIEKNRQTLWPAYKKAKALRTEYRKVEMIEDKLVLDNHTYTVQNMHTLPININPSTKAEKTNESTVAFFGKQSPLSNHHPASFKHDGQGYNCTEQYLMKEKALLFNDEATAYKIMASKNPVEQKHLGKKVEKLPNYNERTWQQKAPKIMETALNAKFSQNKTLCKWLLDTKDKTLAEASRDKFWGVGLGLHDSKIMNTQLWKGQNTLGKALMKVRTLLKPKN
mgnify:CR=1 FL=1